MSKPSLQVLRVNITLIFLVIGAAASAHFLLSLNVRVFHVEHTNEGLRVFARMPMPYLVADKIGEIGDDGLPASAPFTANAIEDDAVVHFLDIAQFEPDRPGLGEIAEAGTHVVVDGKEHHGTVENVVLHRVGGEPGFATLFEARAALENGTTVKGAVPYVGDVIVDVEMTYLLDTSPGSYSLSSSLDPGLPDQEMTANLILDYAPGEPLVYRSRGLLIEPVEISKSTLRI